MYFKSTCLAHFILQVLKSHMWLAATILDSIAWGAPFWSFSGYIPPHGWRNRWGQADLTTQNPTRPTRSHSWDFHIPAQRTHSPFPGFAGMLFLGQSQGKVFPSEDKLCCCSANSYTREIQRDSLLRRGTDREWMWGLGWKGKGDWAISLHTAAMPV